MTPGQRVEAALSDFQLAPRDPSTLPIVSPWSSSHLERVVFEDIFGTDLPVSTRAQALRIPAIARARTLLVSTIARQPLVAFRAGGERLTREQSPTWLYRTDQATPPQLRHAWTADDLIFYGCSLWSRTNAADTRFPLTFNRVNYGTWTINPDNRVEIDGIVQRDEDVLLIGGLHEGILSYGREALDDARMLYAAVRQRLRNPLPGIDLHQTGGEPLNDTEIDDLITRWASARQGKNGGVSFTNQSVQANVLAGDEGQLLVEARNAAAVDMARIIGVSAGMLDATAPKASLNYETQAGRQLEFVDLDVRTYMDPIAWRLSLDDCVAAGTYVAFDTAATTAPVPSPAGPALED